MNILSAFILPRSLMRLLGAYAFVLWAAAPALHAQAPFLVNYQGRVAVGGVNFSGSGAFSFALVNTNGTTSYWSNDGVTTGGAQPTTAVTLTVTNGLYSVLLGDTTVANMATIPASVWSNADVRLRVWFNDGTDGFQLLTPDQRLAPNGYLPAGSVSSAAIAAGAVTNAQLAVNAVQAGNIVAGAVGSTQLGANAVQTGNIAAGAVGTPQLASGGVQAGDLAPGLLGIPPLTAWPFGAPVSVSGTTQTAVANTAYTATNANNTAFTLPTNANVGDEVQITGLGAGGWSITAAAQTTGLSSSAIYSAIASSADGTKLVAGAGWSYAGQIYTSTNSGATWTVQSPSSGLPTSAYWVSVASSTDGTHLVAASGETLGFEQTGQIYTSTNSGLTWTTQSGAPTISWTSVASSADGSHLVAVSFYSGGVWTSTNSGVTWTLQTGASGGDWDAVASSADGTHLIAAGDNGVYTSADSGVTWTAPSQNSGLPNGASEDWFEVTKSVAVASSADGTHLIAGEPEDETGSGLYISVNSGATWTEVENGPLDYLGDEGWSSMASSADGTHLVAIAGQGYVCTSTDSGATWSITEPANGSASVACSSDGTKIFIGGWGGAVYTKPNIGGAQGTTAALQYLGNGQWAIVGQSYIPAMAVGGTQIATGAVSSSQLASGLTLGGTTTIGGDLSLPATTGAGAGVLNLGGVPFLQTYSAVGSNGGNTFVGLNAGNFTTGGIGDTANGADALSSNGAANYNTASGAYALQYNTTGANNTASGALALNANIAGGNNTASGAFALNANVAGSDNTAAGYEALSSNTYAGQNVAIGSGALSTQSYLNGNATWATQNVALGYNALKANQPTTNSNGYQNTALGALALAANTTGFGNTASGLSALGGNTLGVYNTAGGTDALANNSTASQNVAVGAFALATQSYNGGSSLWYSNNVAVGFYALNSNQPTNTGNGNNNTAIGTSALGGNTTGASNTASGFQALLSSTTGNSNTATGFKALSANTTGGNNTALGAQALSANTAGNNNTGIGIGALGSVTTGTYNTGLGFEAGENLTSGSFNIDIGNNGVAGDSLVTRIGSSQTMVFIAGIRGIQTGSTNTQTVLIDSNGQLGTIQSSRRYKEDIADMAEASTRLLSLRPVTFRYKKPYANGEKPIQFGLIAEEVAEVFPELTVFNDQGEPESVKYQDLPAMLLNEFLKDHRRAEARDAEIAKLRDENAAMKQHLAELEAKDKEREARVTRLESLLPTAPAPVLARKAPAAASTCTAASALKTAAINGN